MQRLRGANGQATAEYVALVALAGVVLTLAAGLTSGGLASHLLAGVQRGLCRVAGTDCPRPVAPRADLEPCPLERAERRERLTETIAVVRLGQSGTLKAVRLSDGRVTVTLADEDASGGEIGAGTRVRLGGRALGGAVAAGLAATWTSGRSWTLPSFAAARRFIDAYGAKITIGGKLVDAVRGGCSLLCDAVGWEPHGRLPEPDELFQESGAAATLAAALGVADGSVAAARALGWSVRRGSATWYLQLGASATGQLGLAGLAVAGAAAGTAVVEYTADGRGRPRELRVQLAVEGAAHIGLQAGGLRATARSGAGAGDVIELEARLDLRDPTSRVTAMRAMRALFGSSSPTSPARPMEALGARLAQHAQIDRRTYALDTTATGIGGQLALGVAAGLGWERTTRGLRLLSAETRLPGLPFLPRDDCRPA